VELQALPQPVSPKQQDQQVVQTQIWKERVSQLIMASVHSSIPENPILCLKMDYPVHIPVWLLVRAGIPFGPYMSK
jgi:hypothetical protein